MTDSTPDFDFEPSADQRDGHRPPFGWILLSIVVGLLILSQLIPYLERKTDKGAAVREARTGIKIAYYAAEGGRRMTGSKDNFKALDSPISAVARLRKTDPDAALIWVVLRDAQGHAIAKEDVQPILNKDEISRRAFARIYTSEKMDPKQADALIAQLPGGFVSRIASVAAWRKAGVEKPAEKVFPDQEVFVPILLAAMLGCASLVGFGLLIAYNVMKTAGKLPAAGFPRQAITAAQADRMAGKTALVLALSFTLPAFLLAPFRKQLEPAALTFLASALALALTLALASLPLFQRRISFAEMGWRSDRLGKDALWGLGAALANAPLLFIVSAASSVLFRGLPPAEHPVTSDLSRMSDPWMLAATVFAAIIVAPIVEETLFRGLLAPAMGAVFQPKFAGWVAAGLCFAAIHPTGIPAWPALATLGVVASITNYQTGSLVSSVFMHGFHNAIILTTAILFLG